MNKNNIKYFLLFTYLLVGFINIAYTQTKDTTLFNCLKWRMIGPYRGGRTVGASGDLQHPNVFYIGVNNGGVWKTNDYGRTWNPIFDNQSTGSIGDVAVAASNSNIIYVCSGEGLQRPDLSVGNGVYKSVDAGKTWQNLGLDSGLQIGGIAIDPKNENIVFAAVLGHPYGPNTQRGVFKTTDGGKTWIKVLYIDENTGAIQVAIDPENANIVYADMYAGRLAPWENGEWHGTNSGLYKSVDGGNTWKQLKNGLPDATKDGLTRIGFCIAPSMHNRLYAVVSCNEQTGGIYRCDDAGENWVKMNADKRLWDRGTDFAEVKVDPKNADIVYDANVVVWKSTDGGKTWDGFKGAPGGDDYHRLWINPQNTDILLCANDQGGIVTVNGGNTWSSWYNQPTAQLYHVSADNAFPYNVYSGQQESGSVGISSRGNDGAITVRDWHSVSAEEYGYVVADPLDPNIIYGGKISKYDKRTGQAQNISPDITHSGKYRFIRTAPIVFSPIDNKTLFYAGNVLFKTRDGGKSWKTISPDLTRQTYDIAESIGIYRNNEMSTMPQRGVIYTIALSPLDSNLIWVGTDDGYIHVTHDGGKNWQNVTPPNLTSWSKISIMDASHTDKNTVFAAVNRIRLDDYHPHIYKTTDGGKTWTEIIKGLPNNPINVVKEDPLQAGLLYAGSETEVYVSFDAGENWQTLRRNMPATSIRDLTIKDDDLIVATHGRSFWIMDNINPLRQIAATKTLDKVLLYKPQKAIRVRWNLNTDTPLPKEEPVGKNPPDGAIIDYYIKDKANSEITLDIIDNKGKTIRHYSSNDTLYTIPNVNIPLYWVRPQQMLSTTAGSHRFLWDMHYTPLNLPPSYAIGAIHEDTPPSPTSPWVMPGNYTVKLSVDGKSYTQVLNVVMDPRVKTSLKDLQLQHDLSLLCYQNRQNCNIILPKLNSIKQQLNNLIKVQQYDISQTIKDTLLPALGNLLGNEASKSLMQQNDRLTAIFDNLQGADMPPTTQCITAAKETNQNVAELLNQSALLFEKIKNFNSRLKNAHLPEIIL